MTNRLIRLCLSSCAVLVLSTGCASESAAPTPAPSTSPTAPAATAPDANAPTEPAESPLPVPGQTSAAGRTTADTHVSTPRPIPTTTAITEDMGPGEFDTDG